MNDDWKKLALCRENKTLHFYSEITKEIREAKALCKRCSVAAECLSEAILSSEIYGVWGGISQRERRKYHNLFPVSIPFIEAKEIVAKHGNTVSIKSG